MVQFPISRVDESRDAVVRMDKRDEKLLAYLSENAREPLSAIARKIHLSKESVHYRLQSLMRKGVILGFYPVLDLREFGFSTYHVFMVINDVNHEQVLRLTEHLVQHSHTRSLMEYGDRWDLEWVLVARNVIEFDNIMTDLTKQFADIIVEKHTFEIIIGYKSELLPYPHEHSMFGMKSQMIGGYDETDLRIIESLSLDARRSTYGVGEELGVSPDTVSYRVKKMVERGIIRQFSIIAHLTALGFHFHTLCINVKTFDFNHELKFREYISAKPHIIRAVKVLGDWDLMLHVVAKDIRELHTIGKELQKYFVDIMVNYQTWGGYKEYCFYPLPRALVEKQQVSHPLRGRGAVV